MTDPTAALVRGNPVGREAWTAWWDRLDAGAVDRAEAAALLAAASARLPDPDTARAFVASLRERTPDPGPLVPGAVNVVGTGGGPGTLNISTAAAFVAAAIGVRVVKTGSRGHSSAVGSIDLLDLLDLRPARSAAELSDALDRFGVAFAGQFAYPPQLARLARLIVPLGMRAVGGFVNTVGPFLAVVPVGAQLTGLSAPESRPVLAALAAAHPGRVWLCHNETGVDELVGFARNTVDEPGVTRFTVEPVSGGRLADLAPAPDRAGVVDRFTAVLSGRASRAAVDTVCLNAAAMAVLGGVEPDLGRALAAAQDAVAAGAATALLDRVRGSAAVAHV
ncbi:hypothetical protein ACQPZF_20045 [Actinosynnema sp. CS-041913]|uniref:hypothetical protein n=1 Tax=Actinosynnema sp. CS-041913 TaxID=3239917 RepID=UPI003D908568